ncbi:DUF6843 domain-containing protein [Bacillus sp. NPDC094106]|uniref:DUF6843 domain-containing protein n=1 Tax=Bacillus sp. NPDC094106 TaxID=3363949 RepID=UPI0038139233
MKKTIIYIGFITTLCLDGCSSLTQRTTDVVYLIPDGYEGDLIVLYNVPGAKPLQTEDGFRVVSFSPDGTAITSTKDMKYGIVNDKYYIILIYGSEEDGQLISFLVKLPVFMKILT